MSKLRIFQALNHLGHNYEQLKLMDYYDVEFTYLINNVRKWNRFAHRPQHPKLKWATSYEPGKYDLAILSVDQQHVNPDLGKGWMYRDLNEVIQDVPKIVINHGTPMYPEKYPEDIVINGGEVDTLEGKKYITGMKEKIGDNFMLVNSYTAVERWGWGYPLIHGLDPDEWFDLPKEPRSIIPVSPGGLDTYYNRELMSHIKFHTKKKLGQDPLHINVDIHAKDWDDYRHILGGSLLTLTPFKDSPMPRSRTEAMLSGSCILTSKYQDVPLFIEHGVNGFIVPDNPMSYAETIYQLTNFHYRNAVEIGQKGRETAIKYFHIERYLSQLWELLNKIASGQRPEWSGETIYGKNYWEWRKENDVLPKVMA